jgi:nuclease|nr:MAG TPA: ParB protein [Caudoviricetes sp.]DAW81703.1 MAG TPA: ParB protein [Caudoviricetes sp.]
MELEKINIEKIKMYENNAKEHPYWQVEEIVKSISAFGYKDPIALDENDIIIEGHGRYLALKQLDFKEIEILRITDLTEEQKAAYAIAHNKLTMNTDFDFETLKYELNKLELADFDLKILGFEETELEKILEESNEEIPIPEYDYDEEEETGKRIKEKMLIIGEKKIPLTEKEYEFLMGKYENYIKENGVAYGFISNSFF